MILVSILLLALLARAAWLDALHRRIPNTIVIGVALLWLTQPLLIGFDATMSALGIATIVLTGGIAAWSAGWIGAGDAKLLAVLALWAGADQWAAFLLATALSGGIMALGLLLTERTGTRSWLMRFSRTASFQLQGSTGQPASDAAAEPACASLPYGVAIAVGGLWLTYHQLFP